MDILIDKLIGKETSGVTDFYIEDESNITGLYSKIKTQHPVDGELFDVVGKVVCVDGHITQHGSALKLSVSWKKYYGK